LFNNLGNLGDLMRNAGKVRETIEKTAEALGQVQAEGTAGGGAVTARVNGRLEVLAVRIDPKLLADGDVELLEDLIAAAVNQGLNRAKEAASRSVQTMAGGMLPPGLGGLFGPPPGAEGG